MKKYETRNCACGCGAKIIDASPYAVLFGSNNRPKIVEVGCQHYSIDDWNKPSFRKEIAKNRDISTSQFKEYENILEFVNNYLKTGSKKVSTSSSTTPNRDASGRFLPKNVKPVSSGPKRDSFGRFVKA